MAGKKLRTSKRPAVKPEKTVEPVSANLFADIRAFIEEARENVSRTVNSTLVLLNWRIGDRIRREILGDERAEYGQRVILSLAERLTEQYGAGYTRAGLFRMVQFAEQFPDSEIVATLSRQLGWSHFIELLVLDDPLKRDYYAEMCRIERWSVRTLRAKIDGMLYERTALSRNTEAVIRNELEGLRLEDRLTPNLVFRDPYVLDFLGLTGAYSEKDLEAAILRELEAFLLEMGGDFAFMARQKRITVDGEDFYLDLLFFHRRLRRLVAVELKLGTFMPADAGQMLLYLGWLDRYERQPNEERPIGLILCAGKSRQRVELLDLESRDVRVAEYLTELPPKPLLENRLMEAVRVARTRIE